MYREFDTTPHVYDGEPSARALVGFLEPLMFPTISSFSYETVKRLGETDLRALLLFRNDEDKDEKYVKVFE